MKLTRHMRGILHILGDVHAVNPTNLIPTALVRLSIEGYVRIGRSATLTRKGKALLASGTVVRPD
jgi:hypothetical protein